MWITFDQILEMKSMSSSVAFLRAVGLIYNSCFYFLPSLQYITIERWRRSLRRNRRDALVADNDSGRPLQRPIAHVSGGRGADEEGGVKATIGGGEGEWAQKWGCNDDDPTKWHWWHRQFNNQLYDGNDGGETGKWPIASTCWNPRKWVRT